MDIKDFLDGLKRDKARGDLAPHQIILLISLSTLYVENNSSTILIEELFSVFNKIWKENQNKFKTKNCNLGMPLKVFGNRGYLEIDISEEIVDFRSKEELKNKIIRIELNTILLNLFQQTEILNHLNKRINI